MYEFSPEEKQSMHKLLHYFIVMRRYKSADILQRIDADALSKRDLTSIQKKLSITIQGLGSVKPYDDKDAKNHMEIFRWVSIVDSALARYRKIDWVSPVKDE